MKTGGFSIAVSMLLLVYSCANIVAPSGGEKDVKPPQLVRSIPDTFTTHFNSKNIYLQFNEFVQLKDISQQLVISPPMKYTPEVKVKKKGVMVHLHDTLLTNTTYTLSFGNAIADITEGNSADNFQYVFSTGAHIDSLSVSGDVVNAFTLAPEKGILVMLYRDAGDSVPYREKPLYFARTNEQGLFRINYMSGGKYKIFALKDQNHNYLFDQPHESIAFLDSLIDPSIPRHYTLRLFDQEPARQFVMKAFAEQYGKITFILSKPARRFTFQSLNDTINHSHFRWKELSGKSDTISFWIGDYYKDTLHLATFDNGMALDTVRVALISKEKVLVSKRKVFFLSVNARITSEPLDIFKPVELTFSHPVAEWNNADSVLSFLKKDSLPADSIYLKPGDHPRSFFIGKYAVSFDTMFVSSPADTGIGIQKIIRAYRFLPWEEATEYTLFIPPGTVKDIFGLTSDTIRYEFKTRSLRDYGSLLVKVKAPPGNYLVQLLDDKNNVVEERLVNGDDSLEYSDLLPKVYRLKAILDQNKNRKWDTGNYSRHQQPERVVFSTGSVAVRASWDVEIEWEIVP